MHEQHSATDQGYSLVETYRGSGVCVLFVVLDQLSTRPYKNNLRHNGDCEHHDHVDTLVDDDILKRRRN